MAPTTPEPRHAGRAWWPWPLTVLVLIGTAASNRQAEVPNPVLPGVLLAVLAVAPAVVAPLRPRIPGWSLLLVSGGLTGAYFALGYGDGPVFLALPAVTYVVASRERVRQWLPWAVAGTGLSFAGLVAGATWSDRVTGPSVWQGVGHLGVVAASGAVATAVRSRLEARAERVERAATEERLRMAQELHDGVGHGLAVIAMQAGVALHVLERDPDKARQSLEAIRATSKEALEALRGQLTVIAGSGSGLDAAPRRPSPGVGDLPALVDRVRAAGLRVEVVGEPGAVPERVGGVVYAVVQESLTNALRHAAAATVATVGFERAPDAPVLVVTVTDDGQGAASSTAGPPTGMGIVGMRQRVEAIRGRFSFGPAERGFRVRAELPLEEGAAG